MLEESTIELVKQYLECQEQFSQAKDEMERISCLHRDWGRTRLEEVQISLQQGKTSRKIEEVLICAQYLAYIVNFEQERANQLQGFRRDYLTLLGRGLCTSSQALRLFAMLCGGEEGEILLYLEEKLQTLTSVSCPKQVSAYLSILEKRTQWILQEKSLTIAHISSSRLLEQSFKFLARYPHPQHPDLLHRMFSLATNLLLLASTQPRFTNNNNEISKLAEGWLSMSVFKKETQYEQFKVLKQSLTVLNPKDTEEYVNFVGRHLSEIGSIRLLQLLKSILDKLQLVSKGCLNELGKIQKSLFQSLLQSPSNPNSDAFRIKNLQVQLIAKLSSSYNCDINRSLLTELRKTKGNSQYAFMSSLLFVFDSRLSAETVKSIEGARLQYLHLAREQAAFEEIARHYCHTNLELEFFQVLNPEILDQFMWEFLLLSTTITKNYEALCQIGKIQGLIANLIKIGLLGVYSDQCYQAIVAIINHQGLYALDLVNISFADIISGVQPIIKSHLNQNNRGDEQKISLMYHFVSKVFSLIASKYNIMESSSLKLFNKLLHLTPEIPSRCITNNFLRQHYKLLLQSIPKDLRRVTSQQINQAIDGILSHLTQFRVGIYMQIYLQLMLRSINIQPLKQIFQATATSIQSLLLQGSIINRNLEDIYKINYFIMMKQTYNQQIVINCWDILLKVDTLTYPHLAYYIIDLFNYFLEWAEQNHSADEIVVQIKLHLSNCFAYLQKLESLILHTDFISRLENFLQLKQSALIFIGKLHQIAINISFDCPELQQLMNHLLNAAKEIREVKFSSRFLKCKHEGIKKLWCDNQFMCLSLCLTSTKREEIRNPRQLLRDLLDLNQRFEWLRKVYPQQCLKNLDQLALYFNCELATLQSRISDLSLLLIS